MSIPGSFIDPRAASIRWEHMDSPPGPPGTEHFSRYRARVHDGVLVAVVSLDGGLWHVSVSHRAGWRDDREAFIRAPTWDELKHAKYSLVPLDIEMALSFPRRSGEHYVDVHPTTLHLWEVRC